MLQLLHDVIYATYAVATKPAKKRLDRNIK